MASTSRRSLDTRQPLLESKTPLDEAELDDLAAGNSDMPRRGTDSTSHLPSWHKDRGGPSPALQKLADTRWIPTRRLWRLVGRRPLLLLIAFGTSVITLAMLMLSRSQVDSDSWTEILEPLFFEPSPVAAPSATPLPMKALSAFTPECLEAWMARGEVCTHAEGLETLRRGAQELVPLDSVWTWVNGSDSRHGSERSYWKGKPEGYSTYVPPPHTEESRLESRGEDEPRSFWRRLVSRAPVKAADKWFRDHNELKYSVRSVRSHLKSLRKSFILATDFPFPYEEPGTGSRLKRQGVYSDILRVGDGVDRQGQWPQWLDPHSQWTRKDGEDTADGGVGVYHHWDFFRPPDTATDATSWKHTVLPTFNSFAIESQLPNLPGLSDVFVYNNDDFFFGRDLATADFYSPMFGTVYRLQGDLLVEPLAMSNSDPTGEWPQLHRSNWHLSERFGSRKRPYITHATKTFNRPLLHESRLMFEDAYALTASHRFRGMGPDVVAIYLVIYMNIERHREALLWSWFMAKMDRDGDGYFSAAERSAIMDELSGGNYAAETVKEMVPKRATLNKNQSSVDAILDAVHFPRKQETAYSFSSHDGYPLVDIKSKVGSYQRTFSNTWPDVYRVSDSAEHEACSIKLPQCFPEGSSTSSSALTNAGEILKRFAFDKVDCGDCLITHLVNHSGKRGLSAFLPSEDSFFPERSAIDIPERASQDPIAFLPVTAGGSWRNIDYSLPYIQNLTSWPSSKSRREFAMQLIHRYSFVLGESSVDFLALRSNQGAQSDMDRLRRNKPAFACINDDIMPGQNRVDGIFSSWLQDSFPDRLPYET